MGEVSSNPDGSADEQDTGIKNIKRTGRGFRNEHNYRTRILLNQRREDRSVNTLINKAVHHEPRRAP